METIKEIKLGRLFAGREYGAALIDLEPVDGYSLPGTALFEECEAEDMLKEWLSQFGEYELTREPYGWTAKGNLGNGDGDFEFHVCWRQTIGGR